MHVIVSMCMGVCGYGCLRLDRDIEKLAYHSFASPVLVLALSLVVTTMPLLVLWCDWGYCCCFVCVLLLLLARTALSLSLALPTQEFLHRIAAKRGKLKRGGTFDYDEAARSVLQDWNQVQQICATPCRSMPTNTHMHAVACRRRRRRRRLAVFLSSWFSLSSWPSSSSWSAWSLWSRSRCLRCRHRLGRLSRRRLLGRHLHCRRRRRRRAFIVAVNGRSVGQSCVAAGGHSLPLSVLLVTLLVRRCVRRRLGSFVCSCTACLLACVYNAQGKIPFYTLPPKRAATSGALQIDPQGWAKEFDLDSIAVAQKADMEAAGSGDKDDFIAIPAGRR